MSNQNYRDDKWKRELTRIIEETLITQGALNLDDFKDRQKLTKKILKISKNANWEIVIDHTDDILNEAKRFASKGDINNTKLFFTLFFEHTINNIILHRLYKKVNKKTINNILRNVNINSKLTWLLEILGLPKISNNHIPVVIKLFEDRNAYVHYKYNISEIETAESLKKAEISGNLKQILNAVTYFKKYQSGIIFNRKKIKINKLLNKTK